MATKTRRWWSVSSPLDRPVQGSDHIAPLGDPGRVEPETVGQPVPVLGVHRHGRSLPEVPAHLGGHLEDGELAGPGREATVSPELADLGDHRHDRVGGCLGRQVVELGAVDGQLASAAAYLGARNPHQQFVEPGHRLVMCRPAGAQALHPALRTRRRALDRRRARCRVGRHHLDESTSWGGDVWPHRRS